MGRQILVIYDREPSICDACRTHPHVNAKSTNDSNKAIIILTKTLRKPSGCSMALAYRPLLPAVSPETESLHPCSKVFVYLDPLNKQFNMQVIDHERMFTFNNLNTLAVPESPVRVTELTSPRLNHLGITLHCTFCYCYMASSQMTVLHWFCLGAFIRPFFLSGLISSPWLWQFFG